MLQLQLQLAKGFQEQSEEVRLQIRQEMAAYGREMLPDVGLGVAADQASDASDGQKLQSRAQHKGPEAPPSDTIVARPRVQIDWSGHDSRAPFERPSADALERHAASDGRVLEYFQCCRLV